MSTPLKKLSLLIIAAVAIAGTATVAEAQVGHYLRIYDETTGGGIVDYLIPLTDSDEARAENLFLEPATYRIETTSRVEPTAPVGTSLYRVQHRCLVCESQHARP